MFTFIKASHLTFMLNLSLDEMPYKSGYPLDKQLENTILCTFKLTYVLTTLCKLCFTLCFVCINSHVQL